MRPGMADFFKKNNGRANNQYYRVNVTTVYYLTFDIRMTKPLFNHFRATNEHLYFEKSRFAKNYFITSSTSGPSRFPE